MITFLCYLVVLFTVVFVLFFLFKRDKTEREFQWMTIMLFAQTIVSSIIALAYLQVL